MTQNLHRELKYQVLHLVCWPSMNQMLDATGADIARICALLARVPSVFRTVTRLTRFMSNRPSVARVLPTRLLLPSYGIA